jgi:hypothetical protein
LRRNSAYDGDSMTLRISEGLGPDEDVEDGPVGPVAFTHNGGGLVMRLTHVTSGYVDDETELFEQTQRVLAPLLTRHRMWLVSAEHDLNGRTGAVAGLRQDRF